MPLDFQGKTQIRCAEPEASLSFPTHSPPEPPLSPGDGSYLPSGCPPETPAPRLLTCPWRPHLARLASLPFPSPVPPPPNCTLSALLLTLSLVPPPGGGSVSPKDLPTASPGVCCFPSISDGHRIDLPEISQVPSCHPTAPATAPGTQRRGHGLHPIL